MTKKNNNKAPAAQQLIDSLLDEENSSEDGQEASGEASARFGDSSLNSGDDETRVIGPVSVDSWQGSLGDSPQTEPHAEPRAKPYERPHEIEIVFEVESDESANLQLESSRPVVAEREDGQRYVTSSPSDQSEPTRVIDISRQGQKKGQKAFELLSENNSVAVQEPQGNSGFSASSASPASLASSAFSAAIPPARASHARDDQDVSDDPDSGVNRGPNEPESQAQDTDRQKMPRLRSVEEALSTLGLGQAAAGQPDQRAVVDRSGVTELKPGGRRTPDAAKRTGRGSSPSAGLGYSSAEAVLKQSESLRIAQSRISDLENELERIRRENEQLASAGETLRRRSDELLSRAEMSEAESREALRTFDEERKILRGQLQQKERENSELRARLEEAEGRLDANFKKIRVRERELEHRLEIVKMENATLVSTKDKMLLDLKRQIDQLAQESEYGKQRAQELFSQNKEKQETIRRVVRALRIALTILEGDSEYPDLKKAE